MSGWYYDFPRAAPRPKPKPGKVGKKFGATWWGKKWVDVLSKYEHDQRMSRSHASITYTGSEFRIRDEKSANGTFLNGSKVVEYAIRDGDKLLVGDTLLRFRVGGLK